MRAIAKACPFCGVVKSLKQNDALSDATLLILALDPNGYAYSDLYLKPPTCGDSWTGEGILFPHITEKMVIARKHRIAKLVREHGRESGWNVDRIEAAVKHAASVWIDRSEARFDLWV